MLALVAPPVTDRIRFPESFLVQNGGPVLDVTRPPSGIRRAFGDGRTDDTEALRDVWTLLKDRYKAKDPFDRENHLYVYFPNGTYRVTDSIIYRGATVGAFPKWDGTWDMNRVHVMGETERGTVIRLDDGASGFADPSKTRPILTVQHPDTVFNNVPGSNWIRNLTIDAGAGNPGAVGLDWQGANNTDLRDLTVRAAPGSGAVGIDIRRGSIQGHNQRVTVDGFATGIRQIVRAEPHTSWERLTLRGQRDSSVFLSGGGMSLLDASISRPPGGYALDVTHTAMPIVIGSRITADVPFVRRTVLPPIREDGKPEGESNFIRWETNTLNGRSSFREGDATHMFSGSRDPAISAVIRPTPEVPWGDPRRDWAVVDDYPSVQAAFDSGRPIVAFRKRRYEGLGEIRVPKTVRAVRGFAAVTDGATFVIAEPSKRSVRFEETGGSIRVDAAREVAVVRSGSGIANPKKVPTTIFLENVNDVATGDDFCPKGTTIYARQIDIEYPQTEQIVVNGGRMWIFGFKTENGTSTPFTVKNGGSLDVQGGYVNAIPTAPFDQQRPIVDLIDAGPVGLSFFTNLNGAGGEPWRRVIRERRGNQVRELLAESLPKRGGEYRHDFVLRRFVGGR